MPSDKGCSFPKRLADKMTGNRFFARAKIRGGSLNLPPARRNKFTNNGYQDTLSTKIGKYLLVISADISDSFK
jgi:hypothetical protein